MSDSPTAKPRKAGRKPSPNKMIPETVYLDPDLHAWADAARGEQPMSEFIRDCVDLRRRAAVPATGKSDS